MHGKSCSSVGIKIKLHNVNIKDVGSRACVKAHRSLLRSNRLIGNLDLDLSCKVSDLLGTTSACDTKENRDDSNR